VLELLAPYRGRPLTAGRAIVSYGSSSRHLAGLHAVLGRTAEAVVLYEEAIAIDAANGLRPWVVRARLGLSRALAAAGRHQQSRDVAAAAAAEARELGLSIAVDASGGDPTPRAAVAGGGAAMR
jgi:hypothetical protein